MPRAGSTVRSGCGCRVLQDAVRGLRTGLEPLDSRVPAEPGYLSPGVTPGQRLRLRDRLLLAQLPTQLSERLRVSDGPGGGDAALDSRFAQPGDLVDEPVPPHPLH